MWGERCDGEAATATAQRLAILAAVEAENQRCLACVMTHPFGVGRTSARRMRRRVVQNEVLVRDGLSPTAGRAAERATRTDLLLALTCNCTALPRSVGCGSQHFAVGEKDDVVAQQAPALLRVIGNHPCSCCVGCPGIWA